MTRNHLLFVLFLTACGGGGSEPDADLGEPGEVLVETWGCCRDALPEPETHVLIGGIELVAVDADGRTIVETTVEGHATLTLHAGASITAIYRRGIGGEGDVSLTTYAGVEPGDTVVFGDYPFPSWNINGRMEVTFPPADTPVLGVVGACGSHSAPEDTAGYVVRQMGCEPPSEDVFVYAYMLDGLRYGVLDDVPFVDGGSVALEAWQTAPSFELRATDLPTGVEQVSLMLHQVSNGRAWFKTLDEGKPTDGQYTIVRDWAPVGDGTNATVRLYAPGMGQWIRTRLPADASSHTFGQADWLPAITDATFDPDLRTASFTAAEDPAVDVLVLGLDWRRLDESGESGYFRDWRVIAPPHLREVRVPELPGELADLMPRASDASYRAGVSLWDVAVDEGYGETRKRPAWDFGGSYEEDFLIEGGRTSGAGLTFLER